MELKDLLFAASLGLNAFTLYKLKTDKPKRAESYDAKALLRDLLNGDSLIRITRIAPEDVFLRSPKDTE